MRVPLAAYLVIGAVLAVLWNRTELGRAPLRRLVPSYCLLVLAWPAVIGGAIAVASVWTLIWRKSHRDGHQSTQVHEVREAAVAAAFADNTPAPRPL